MGKEVILYWVLLLFFTSISFYNFKIRKECIYPVKLTKPRAILILIIPLIFLGLTYSVGHESWLKYLLAVSASLLIISRVVGEGIHEEGIYYHSGRRILATLAKWEDIKDIEIDINKNQLKSFTNTRIKVRIYPDQYYSCEDINYISKYLKDLLRT